MKIYLAALLLSLIVLFSRSMEVYAADGKLSIAVSSQNLTVGDTLTVTLRATGPGGESATADMVFTYNSGILSFVSCDASGSSGGDGTVTATGSTVTVKLEVVGTGSANLGLKATNGVINSSQEALDSMTAAGTSVTAGGGASTERQSNDNSLKSLSLSVGELSPEFSYSVLEYTATVPYETESVEVNARTSNSAAEIEAILGNTNLQVGENEITLTIRAENGARVVYRIVVTRQEQETGTGTEAEPGEGNVEPEPDVGETGTEEPAISDETAARLEEYEEQLQQMDELYGELQANYKAEKSFARRTIAILAFVVVVLLIVIVNLLLFIKRRRNEESWIEPPAVTKSSGRSRLPFRKKDGMETEDDDEDLDEPDESEEAAPVKEKKQKQKKGIEIVDLDDL